MAGAFSGHLLQTFNRAQPSTPTIVTSGAVSFDARAHGSAALTTPFSPDLTPLTEESTRQIATLQVKLNKKLGPEYISQRPGPSGGPKLIYAEGWKIINLANEVFGFNGWSSSIISVSTDFIDCNETSKRFDMGVTAVVRVTLRDGAYHEDVGYGMIENAKSKAAGLDKCKKEAVTDALKRTLRSFGNLLGNCLYDKSYAQEVVKIKVPPVKLDKGDLYRRPEFEESTRSMPAPVAFDQPVAGPSTSRCEEPRVKVENENNRPSTPIVYIPRHVREEMTRAPAVRSLGTPTPKTPATPNAQASSPGAASASNAMPVNVPKSGLATPVQTPMQLPRMPPPPYPASRGVAPSPLAQMRSTPEPNVPASDPPSTPARASSADTAAPPVSRLWPQPPLANDEDDDPFPLSTQDGALFASIELNFGDASADLGRPIDYEEGTDGMSVMTDKDASMLELPGPGLDVRAVQSPVVLPQPQPRVCDQVKSEATPQPAANAGADNITHSNANETMGRGSLAQVQSTTVSAGQSAQESQTAQSRPSFHPVGAVQQLPQAQKYAAHLPKSDPPNVLKRNADMMQAGSSTRSPRPPMRGRGLSHGQQQSVRIRGPSENCDDSKRFKC